MNLHALSSLSNNIILHGGGFESSLLLRKLHRQDVSVQPVCVDYGQVAFKAEASAVDFQIDALNQENDRGVRIPKAISLKAPYLKMTTTGEALLFGDKDGPEELPNRNLFLIMSVAIFQPKAIYTGSEFHAKKREDWYEDGTPEFYQKVREMLQSQGTSIRTPLIDKITFDRTKTSLLQREGGDTSMNYFSSCWTPVNTYTRCGTCNHCIKEYFLRNQFSLPQPKYATPISTI